MEVYFLRRALRNLVDDQGMLHGMADELLQSAMDRCVQPVLLDAKVRIWHRLSLGLFS